jgi:hypothetical protein
LLTKLKTKYYIHVRVREMEFECKRCGYCAKQKGNLKLHLTKKTICPPLKDEQSREALLDELYPVKSGLSHHCPCGKAFASRQGLYLHKRKCNVTNDEATSAHLDKDVVILELQREILKMKDQINKTPTPTTINNNTQNVQNITINMLSTSSRRLNNFGAENTEHIDSTFLKNCLLNLYDGVKEYVNEVHLNPEVPENHNIRFKSSKNKTLEIFKDDKWIETNQATILDTLIKNGYRVLNQFYMENIDSDSDIQSYQDQLNTWLWDISQQTGTAYWRLRKDICLLVKNSTIYALTKS